eukprot:406454-Alexandrium_andersonii.AAC.1
MSLAASSVHFWMPPRNCSWARLDFRSALQGLRASSACQLRVRVSRSQPRHPVRVHISALRRASLHPWLEVA